MPSKMLKEFLDKNKIKYVTIKHSLAFTAQEIAASAHIKGTEMAKTVLIKIDGKMAMFV
ncbi:MAG: deacylase, partial [Bacteroidetes bacterium]|nr:deacylase [Bacteroidota bacterium]